MIVYQKKAKQKTRTEAALNASGFENSRGYLFLEQRANLSSYQMAFIAIRSNTDTSC